MSESEVKFSISTDQLDNPEETVSDEKMKEKLSRINFDTLREKLSEGSVFLSLPRSEPRSLEVIASLIVKLESSLPKFDVLLSDDASGHLLTLLLRKLIDKARTAQGKRPVETYFLAVSSNDPEERMKQRSDFLKTKILPETKVLVVTEYIESGRNIMKIIEALQSLTDHFRVATISMLNPISVYERFAEDESKPYFSKFGRFLDKVFWGKTKSGAGCILYGGKKFSGVQKDSSNTSVHPSVYREDPKKIESARKDIDILVEEFTKLLG